MMTFPKKIKMTRLIAAVFCIFHAVSAHAGLDQTIEHTLKFGQKDAKYGQIKLDFRYRFEQHDSENPVLKIANASTARLQLGYLTPDIEGFQGYVEYASNQDMMEDDYNSTRNGKTQFEKIIDPQQKLLNQAWIAYKGLSETEIKIGRQHVALNNERFLSGLNWRQLQQNFDGLLITNRSIENTEMTLGYLIKRQSIDGTVQGMQFPFINLSYQFEQLGNLTGYALFMDFNEKHEDSNQTYGVLFEGSQPVTQDIRASYAAEYAYQQDYVQSPVKYHADYYHVTAGISALGITGQIGIEKLGGKGVNKTFDTPLGLLHFANGWADQFVVTPHDGLRDVYGSLMAEVEGLKIIGAYHQFTNDSGKVNIGDEWNFLLSYDVTRHYNVLVKYAYFNADESSDKFDTQKIWLSAGVKF